MNSPFEAELRQLRSEIDRIDRMLLGTIVQRVSISISIATLKASKDVPLLNPQREAEVIQDRSQTGSELGLPSDLVGILFRDVLDLCRGLSSEKIGGQLIKGGVHESGESCSTWPPKSTS
jgi:chorismate mutase